MIRMDALVLVTQYVMVRMHALNRSYLIIIIRFHASNSIRCDAEMFATVRKLSQRFGFGSSRFARYAN